MIGASLCDGSIMVWLVPVFSLCIGLLPVIWFCLTVGLFRRRPLILFQLAFLSYHFLSEDIFLLASNLNNRKKHLN